MKQSFAVCYIGGLQLNLFYWRV